MADRSCECKGGSIILFPCSGGSNVGQIANAAAVGLTQQQKGNMYCLIGVAAHIAGMVESTAGADYRVVIDGCPVACGRKALEHLGIKVDKAVVVTELGIQKNHDFVWSSDELERVMAAATIS
jgi:uncharacterized metal-binding protein